MKKSTCAMKNAVGKWGLMYTFVREKLGLRTIKMADGLVNKCNKEISYTNFFFFSSHFSYCDLHGSHPGSHGSHPGSHD